MDSGRKHGLPPQRRSVACVQFSTDPLEPSQRFGAWCDYAGSVNEIVIPPEARSGFSASTTNWRLGRIMVGVVETPAMRLARDAARVRRDDLDHWVLRVSLQGGVTSRSGERVHRTEPGDLVLETLAAPFEDDWEAGEWVTAAFPRDLAPGLARRDPREAVGPLRGTPARVLGDFLVSLAAHLPQAAPEELPRLASAARGMIAATFDAGGPGADGPARPTAPLRARVEQVIRRNIASARLDPERIADLVGVSRTTLYRLFEGEGGVYAHVQRVRLEGVRADLADAAKATEPIFRIAERWGFYSVTSFNRSFRAAFGMTPGEARQAGLAVAPAARARPRASGRDDYAALLLSV